MSGPDGAKTPTDEGPQGRATLVLIIAFFALLAGLSAAFYWVAAQHPADVLPKRSAPARHGIAPAAAPAATTPGAARGDGRPREDRP